MSDAEQGGTTRAGLRRARGRDQARAVHLRAVHARQRAVRRADRRRRLGARLVDRPRRAPGVPRRRDRRRHAAGGPRALPRRRAAARGRHRGAPARAPASCSTACRRTPAARSPASTSRLPMEWHQRHPTGQLLSNANSDVEAAWGPIAPLPMAVGTVAMMVIAVVQMLLADLVLAVVGLLVFPAVVVANLVYQRLCLAAGDPRPAAARRGQRGRARVASTAPWSSRPSAARTQETERFTAKAARAARRQHPRRPDPRPSSTRPSRRCPTSACSWCSPSGSAGCIDRGTPTPATWSPSPTSSRSSSFPIRSIGWLLGEFPRSVVGSDRVHGGPRGHRRDDVRRPRYRAPTEARRPARRSTDLGYAYDPDVSRCCEDRQLRRSHPGPHRRRRRRDRVRQEHADQPGRAPRRPRRRPDPRSTASTCATSRRGGAGRGGRAGAADSLPVRRHGARQRHPRRRRPRRRGLGRPAGRPGRRLRRGAARTASTPGSASAAPRSPAASASGSRWPGRWCADPRLLVLDDATSAVDPRGRGSGSSPRSGDRRRDATAASSSPTARRPSPSPTRSSTSRTAGSSTAAPTTSCSPAARRTPRLVNAYEQERRAARTPPARRRVVEPTDQVVRRPGSTPARTSAPIGRRIRRGVAALAGAQRRASGSPCCSRWSRPVGQVVVPIAVQQTLDHGLNAPGGPDVALRRADGRAARSASWSTSVASYLMTIRLFTTSERGLATLRIKAFRHVHDLPLLTQNTERRGALVSRVTTDVDQVSQFLVFGGLIFMVSVGQMLVATVVMVDLQLAARGRGVGRASPRCSSSIRYFQRKLVGRPTAVVREQVGVMLGRDLRAGRRRGGRPLLRRRGPHPERASTTRSTSSRRPAPAPRGSPSSRSRLGGISAGLANAGVIVVGMLLGLRPAGMTVGEVLAFAFLVTLFVGPVQMGTQILTDAQNAIAGWRRVIGILDTPADVVDPGPDGAGAAARARSTSTSTTSRSPTPAVRRCSTTSTSTSRRGTRVAIVGETGSGKSTIAKLLTRLMDPSEGAVLLDGVDVRDGSPPASLRRSVVLVPQEGFLFDDTHHRQRPLRPARRRPRPTSWPAPTSSGLGRLAGHPAARARHARSASAASRCRRGSGSSSRCCAPTSPTPTCWSSTRRPAPSTRHSRCGSAGRSSG